MNTSLPTVLFTTYAKLVGWTETFKGLESRNHEET